MQPGSCFCCCRRLLLLLLLLLVLPGARSHLAGTEETSGLPISPQAGCRQQRGDSSRILMKLTQIDRRGANQLISNHSARCERPESLTEIQTALLLLLHPLPCPLPCTCLLLCSLLRTDSKIPEKSRPDAPQWEPLSHTGGREGRRKSPITSGPGLDRTVVVIFAYSQRRTETSLPHR